MTIFGLKKVIAVPEERRRAFRRPRWRQETVREWIGKRGKVSDSGGRSRNRGLLAEALLIRRGEFDRIDQDAGAAADHSLVSEGMGSPGEANSRAEDVRLGVIDIRVASRWISESAIGPERLTGRLGLGFAWYAAIAGRGDRVGCVRVEADHRPVVALGLREVMIETDPRLRVRLLLTRQSSLMKDAHELGLHGALRIQIETSAELGIPRRNCARSCPNTLVLLTAGSLVHVPVNA